MADDVAALIKALDLQRPFVLGYSDGGQISLELGMRYPGMAGALVLGGTQFRFSEAYLEAVRELLSIADDEEGVDTERLKRSSPTSSPTCARDTGTSTARSTGRRT
jgi:pimeloyl-ACP methyl ester carboxylesterase